MGRASYKRIEIPADTAADSFQTKFYRDFQAAKGRSGADILRVGHDHTYEDSTVLCLAVSGTPSRRQAALLNKFSP